MRVLFFGSSHVGGICLEYLFDNDINIIGVVTTVNQKHLSIKTKIKKIFKYPFFIAIDKIRNLLYKETPSFDFLDEYNIKNIVKEKKIDLYDVDVLNDIKKLQKLAPDLIIVASFGKLLKPELLNLPHYGCINLHPSYLPEYRGGCPAYSLIRNDEKFGGATVHKMNEKFDEGDIIYQKKIELKDLNSIQYEIEVANVGKKLILRAISDIYTISVNYKKQNSNAKNICYLNSQISCLIDWNSDVKDIVAQIKACYHPNTSGAYSYNFFKKVYIVEASVFSFEQNCNAGTFYKSVDDGLVFQATNGKILISKIFFNGKYYKNQELHSLNIKRLTKWHFF